MPGIMLRSIMGAGSSVKKESRSTSAQRKAEEKREREQRELDEATAASRAAFKSKVGSKEATSDTSIDEPATTITWERRGSAATSGSGTEDAGSGEEVSNDDETEVYAPRIEFFHKGHDHFWLSNSSPHPVVLDGVTYKTAEHLFQASKFNGHRPDIAARVRKAATPSDAMLEARKNINEVRKGWVRLGLNVSAMREVLLLKFSQHSKLRRQLLLTGDAELVEANPGDVFWASGAAPGLGNGVGRNELGRALMKVRETLRNSAGLGIGSGALTV